MARGTAQGRPAHVAETAELHRDVISAVAHELGGIASALDLRAAALAGMLPETDLAALRGLSEELRVATRAVRLVRGANVAETLAPSRLQSLEDWWRLASRFGGVTLPRGTSVRTHLAEARLTAAGATTLTWLWLAACKELTERDVTAPCTIDLRGGPAPDDDGKVLVTAEVSSDHVALTTRRVASRWTRYALRVARSHGVEIECWTRQGSVLRWRCLVTRV